LTNAFKNSDVFQTLRWS